MTKKVMEKEPSLSPPFFFFFRHTDNPVEFKGHRPNNPTRRISFLKPYVRLSMFNTDLKLRIPCRLHVPTVDPSTIRSVTGAPLKGNKKCYRRI